MSTEFTLEYLEFETPLGWMIVAASPKGLSLVEFSGRDRPSAERIESIIKKEYPDSTPRPGKGSGLAGAVKGHVLDYLKNRKPLPEVPLDVRKGTEFERMVWSAISAIPFGQTRSYKEIARSAGKPAGARAAGRACGKNPVPLFVPCHRVVTSDGKTGGFSGGPEIKPVLLELEKAGAA